jgi:hypothetical protein
MNDTKLAEDSHRYTRTTYNLRIDCVNKLVHSRAVCHSKLGFWLELSGYPLRGCQLPYRYSTLCILT